MSAKGERYRVPTASVQARLRLRDRTELEAEVFVDVRTAHEPPVRGLRRLLERPEPFFPARDRLRDRVRLIRRDAVEQAEVAVTADDASGEFELFDRHCWVALGLEDGARLLGELFYVAPEGRGRVVDHLNGPEQFLLLYRGPSAVLVRKARVVWVEETEAPKEPAEAVGERDTEGDTDATH